MSGEPVQAATRSAFGNSRAPGRSHTWAQLGAWSYLSLAYEALEQAGHHAKVVKAYGTRLLPDFVGERVAHDASVPVLVTDEGEIVSEARSIVA
jgi:hypothetical protein